MEIEFPDISVTREKEKGKAAFGTVVNTKDGQVLVCGPKKSVVYNTCLRLGVSCSSEKIQKLAFVKLQEGDKNGTQV